MSDQARDQPVKSPIPQQPGPGDAASSVDSADFVSPEGIEESPPVELSLEERINQALNSLSDVLQQADPFGELAKAAAQAQLSDDGINATEGASISASDEAEDDDREDSFEPVDLSEDPIEVQTPLEAEASPLESPDGVPQPSVVEAESSMESIEALLGEVDEILNEVDQAHAVDSSEAELLSEAMRDEAEPVADADADTDFVVPSRSDETIAGIADALEAMDAAEGVPVSAEASRAGDAERAESSEPVESAAPAEERASPEAEDDGTAASQPAAVPPIAQAAVATAEAGAARAERPAAAPVRNEAPVSAPAPASGPEPARASSVAVKPEPIITLWGQRGWWVRWLYVLCTLMSRPLCWVPVSMRDPLGAIAAFTLINAVLVWVLAMVFR